MIGILVIGQSPRPGLLQEFQRIIPSAIDIKLVGVLDGLSKAELSRLQPVPGEETLFAVLPDGSDIRLSHEAISRLVLPKLRQLADEGCEIVLFCCTGEFPALEDHPFILPADLLTKSVSAIVKTSRLGVFAPLPEQIETVRYRWQAAGVQDPAVIALSPNATHKTIIDAAREMTKLTPDFIVYDCMSYTYALRSIVENIIKRPSVLSVSLIARILAELVEN